MYTYRIKISHVAKEKNIKNDEWISIIKQLFFNEHSLHTLKKYKTTSDLSNNNIDTSTLYQFSCQHHNHDKSLPYQDINAQVIFICDRHGDMQAGLIISVYSIKKPTDHTANQFLILKETNQSTQAQIQMKTILEKAKIEQQYSVSKHPSTYAMQTTGASRAPVLLPSPETLPCEMTPSNTSCSQKKQALSNQKVRPSAVLPYETIALNTSYKKPKSMLHNLKIVSSTCFFIVSTAIISLLLCYSTLLLSLLSILKNGATIVHRYIKKLLAYTSKKSVQHVQIPKNSVAKELPALTFLLKRGNAPKTLINYLERRLGCGITTRM